MADYILSIKYYLLLDIMRIMMMVVLMMKRSSLFGSFLSVANILKYYRKLYVNKPKKKTKENITTK